MSDAVLSQFSPPVHGEAPAPDGRVLKFGLIGTGWIAESYVQSIARMPDVEIAAAADLNPGKAAAFFRRLGVEGVRLYPDQRAMLAAEKGLDAVCVCTYNATHAECSIDALNAGMHVILEKPMAVSLEEAAAVVRAERKSGRILSLGFQPRMDANMQMVKKVVDSGELGRVYYIQTGGGRRRGIPGGTFIEKRTAGHGALADIGCYALDMVLNAVGYPRPLTVSGYTSAFFGTNPAEVGAADAARFDVDDFAAAFIRLEGDIILDFRIAWAMNIDTPGDTIILGTEGGLRVPSTACWNGAEFRPMTVYRQAAGKPVEYRLPMEPESGGKSGLFYAKIRAFADAIKTGGRAPVPSSQILVNQAIIDAVARSARLGREVAVELPEDLLQA